MCIGNKAHRNIRIHYIIVHLQSYGMIFYTVHSFIDFQMIKRLLPPRTLFPLRVVRCKSESTTLSEASKPNIRISGNMEKSPAKGKTYLLAEFFDEPKNWSKRELNISNRPGRSWSKEELRVKSSGDLHKLWYVLLKERNMLLTMQNAYRLRHWELPNPERLDRVQESMDNLEAIVHERNDAFLRLETGDGAGPPKRQITSFAGFTYSKSATEHRQPFELTEQKEYEVPMLDEQAHIMQKLWKEKEQMKKEIEVSDEYLMKDPDRPKNWTLVRGLRRHFDRAEDLPENVVAKRREVRANFQPPEEPI